MSDEADNPAPGFNFLPEFASLIAHAANRWSFVDYYINLAIWRLADLRPAIGACLTSQMYTTNAKLSALLSLLKLRKADQSLIDRVNRFSSNMRDALEARNRAVHDIWLNNYMHPDQMGKLRITADKKLDFGLYEVALDDLRQDNETIEKRRLEAKEIHAAVKAAIPSLPEMSVSELLPIIETPSTP